jgi:hypothetical protein
MRNIVALLASVEAAKLIRTVCPMSDVGRVKV